MDYKYIEPDKISEMLFNESEYVIEFCEAGVLSFTEFKDNFHNHLLDRNMKKLREAGHKIKPGAKMMGAIEVVDNYEKAKKRLDEDGADEELKELVDTMDSICTTIIDELNHLAQNPD